MNESGVFMTGKEDFAKRLIGTVKKGFGRLFGTKPYSTVTGLKGSLVYVWCNTELHVESLEVVENVKVTNTNEDVAKVDIVPFTY